MSEFGRSKTKRGLRRTQRDAVLKLGRIAQGGDLYYPQTIEDVVEGRDPEMLSEDEKKMVINNLEIAAAGNKPCNDKQG